MLVRTTLVSRKAKGSNPMQPARVARSNQFLSHIGAVADECRWNYIAIYDVVAGSSPVRSNTVGR